MGNGIVNRRIVGGLVEKTFDRNVILVDAPNVDHSKGGLLAIDFDSLTKIKIHWGKMPNQLVF